jgi:hypothetical protein
MGRSLLQEWAVTALVVWHSLSMLYFHACTADGVAWSSSSSRLKVGLLLKARQLPFCYNRRMVLPCLMCLLRPMMATASEQLQQMSRTRGEGCGSSWGLPMRVQVRFSK